MSKLKNDILSFFKDIYEKGFFHLFSANVLIQAFSFASQLFVAGILVPDDIARIKIIQTFLSVFSIIAMMGFNSSTLKLCSEGHITDKDRHGILKTAFIFTLITSTLTYLIVLGLNFFDLLSSDTYVKWLIPIGLFPLISNSLFQVFVAYTQAIKQIKLMSRLTISNKLISILGIILFTSFWGIKGYYIAYNTSFILMLIVCIYVFYHFLKIKLFQPTGSDTPLKTSFQMHWQYASPSMFANLFAEIAVYIDILLISMFFKNLDMTDVGYYSFALTLAIILRLFPATVQQITLPYFSSYAGDKEKFISTYKRYNKILVSVVIATFFVVIAVIPIFINLVYAGKYDPSMQYFFPLAIGISIRQLAQLQSSAVFGLGKIQYTAYNNLISIFINIVLYTTALHFWGLTGAAYTSIIANSIYLLIYHIFFRKAIREL